MNLRWTALVSVVLLGGTLVAADAFARSQISYGRITNVRTVNVENQGAQTAGTLVGGALGIASGSGQSRSNRALRGVGGAAVGSRVAGAAGSSTGFEYTVLIGGTNTIRITTEQAGLRVGDCVSVERGTFNNLRMAADAKCAPNAQPSNEDLRASEACLSAKEALFEAQTDEAFNIAERRVRLLCNH